MTLGKSLCHTGPTTYRWSYTTSTRLSLTRCALARYPIHPSAQVRLPEPPHTASGMITLRLSCALFSGALLCCSGQPGAQLCILGPPRRASALPHTVGQGLVLGLAPKLQEAQQLSGLPRQEELMLAALCLASSHGATEAQQAVGGRGQKGQATPLQGRLHGGRQLLQEQKKEREEVGGTLPSPILDLHSRRPHPHPTSRDQFLCQASVMNPTLLVHPLRPLTEL